MQVEGDSYPSSSSMITSSVGLNCLVEVDARSVSSIASQGMLVELSLLVFIALLQIKELNLLTFNYQKAVKLKFLPLPWLSKELFRVSLTIQGVCLRCD